MPSHSPATSMHRTTASRFSKHLLLLAVLIAGPARGALVHYELTLTTNAPYTAFGGGAAGDIFTGTFGFDEILLGSSGPVFDPILSNNALFFDLGIQGTHFSGSVPGTLFDKGLFFQGGALLDIFFDLTNPNGDRLEVSTISGVETVWTATENGTLATAGGNTLPSSVQFTQIPVPEPSVWALGLLGTLSLLRRRRPSAPTAN